MHGISDTVSCVSQPVLCPQNRLEAVGFWDLCILNRIWQRTVHSTEKKVGQISKRMALVCVQLLRK